MWWYKIKEMWLFIPVVWVLSDFKCVKFTMVCGVHNLEDLSQHTCMYRRDTHIIGKDFDLMMTDHQRW